MSKYPLRPYQSLALAALQAQMAGGIPASQMLLIPGMGFYGSQSFKGNSEGTPLSIYSSEPFRQNYPEWAQRIGGYLRNMPPPSPMNLDQFCREYYPGGYETSINFMGADEALENMVREDLVYGQIVSNYKGEIINGVLKMGRQSKDAYPYLMRSINS